MVEGGQVFLQRRM